MIVLPEKQNSHFVPPAHLPRKHVQVGVCAGPHRSERTSRRKGSSKENVLQSDWSVEITVSQRVSALFSPSEVNGEQCSEKQYKFSPFHKAPTHTYTSLWWRDRLLQKPEHKVHVN